MRKIFYTFPHALIYYRDYPQGSGCLQSVNVTADQYYGLTTSSAAD